MRVPESRALRCTLSIDFAIAVIFSLAATFCVSLPAHSQRGALTLPLNLADLSSNASQIIQGRVVSATVAPDPHYGHLKILVLTLAVDDVLKGQAATTFTFREFLWDIRDISDAAGYHVGEEVLLFLNHPTSLGLITPVGLQQGRFRVVKGSDGHEYAVNASQNSGLLDNVLGSGALNASKLSAKSRLTVQSFQRGPMPLAALKESVHLLVQSPGVVR
jgi:hypothetical protein